MCLGRWAANGLQYRDCGWIMLIPRPLIKSGRIALWMKHYKNPSDLELMIAHLTRVVPIDFRVKFTMAPGFLVHCRFDDLICIKSDDQKILV